MRCLGLESTAHTFGASVADSEARSILSDVKDVYLPPEGSGIHPREAARHHVDVCNKIVRRALINSKLNFTDLDGIAFSAGPGLGPCLRVGAVLARSLASYFRKDLVSTNHAIGHIELSIFLTGCRDPVTLLVSGGHTIIAAFDGGRWRVFGETLDLTIGQLIDQLGRTLGYSSPCGSRIEVLATKGKRILDLPYTVKGNDVSLSGVLTAANRLLQSGYPPEDVAYSVQETAFSMLAEASERAIAFTGKREFMVVGGVAANKSLNEKLKKVCRRQGAEFFVPPISYTGDCGAQIAWTGLLQLASGQVTDLADSVVKQSWRLDQVDCPWRS